MKKRRQTPRRKTCRKRNSRINFRAYSRTAALNPLRKGRKISPAQIRMGTRVELEHTKSRKRARKIAMDHLRETPNYYTRLRKCFPGEHHNPTMTVVDPSGTRPFAINPRKKSKGKEVKATYMSKGYAHKVYIPNWKRVIDPRSIRTKVIRTKDGGKRLLRFGCPKGQWMPKLKHCKVGTKAISILTPKEEKITKLSAGLKFGSDRWKGTIFASHAAGNPPRMSGKSRFIFPLARRGRGIATNPFRGTEAEQKRLIALADKLERTAKRKERLLWNEIDLSKKEREEYKRLLAKVEVTKYPRSAKRSASMLPYTGEEFLRIARSRGYRNPESTREMEYRPGMRIRNLGALPRGLGAKYLVVIPAPESDPGAWVAKAWARERPMLTGIEHLLVLKS